MLRAQRWDATRIAELWPERTPPDAVIAALGRGVHGGADTSNAEVANIVYRERRRVSRHIPLRRERTQ